MSDINKSGPRKVFDSLVNFVSGMGTSKQRSTNTVVGANRKLVDEERFTLYEGSWMFEKAVNMPSDDATRAWVKFTKGLEVKQVEELEAYTRRLDVKQNINFALKMARVYGNCLVVMITKKGNELSSPLKLESITKDNPIVALQILEKDRLVFEDSSQVETNIASPLFGKTKYYKTISDGRGDKEREIHASRVLNFAGKKLPQKKRVSHNGGWDNSIIDSMYDPVVNLETCMNSVVELMGELNMDVVSVENLDSLSRDPTSFAAVIERFKQFSMLKSVHRVALIDKNEDLTRMELKLTGARDIIQTYMELAAAAADIPMTKFFGTSAKGMNATGEGDAKDYAERIVNIQEFELRPNLETLFDVLNRSLFGEVSEDFTFEFNKLDNPSDKVIAETHELEAKEVDILIRNNVVSAKEVRASLSKQGRFEIDGDIPEEELVQPKVDTSTIPTNTE